MKISKSYAFIKECGSYVVWCKTKSFPKWLYNNKPIFKSQDIRISPHGVLQIDEVKREHSGTYECRGTTNQGVPYASMTQLLVTG